MSICEAPNPTTLRAGPPLRQYRYADIYDRCIVHENLNTRELTEDTDTYSERPFIPSELPDFKDYDRIGKGNLKPNELPRYKEDVPQGEGTIPRGIYVIPYDRPETILVSRPHIVNWNLLQCRTQKNGSKRPIASRKASPSSLTKVYHTYLTSGAPVLAAGEFMHLDGNKIQISNESGHYIPSESSLEYAKCLFQKKGYSVQTRILPRQGNSAFNRNSKTLSEWSSKPYKDWYIEMRSIKPNAVPVQPIAAPVQANAAPVQANATPVQPATSGVTTKGGKRKTKRQAPKKHQTRKSMRGKNI